MRKNNEVLQKSAVSLASRVAAELMKINRLLTHGNRPLNKNGRRRIGPTQGRILAILRSRDHDSVTLSALAEGMALSHATASEAVRALEARGFVRKARSRDDARVVYLSLSAAGRRKAEQSADGNRHLCKAIERLTCAEQKLVLHSLKNIQKAVSRIDEAV